MDLLKKALAVLLLAVPCYAGDILVSQFSGLNTQDSPAAIDASQAQALLNVNLTPGGKAVYKRDGYGLYANLPVNTSSTAVHGGYHFQQTGGNDVQLWGDDSSIVASVNQAAFVAVSTMTSGSTLQCADSQGFAYCFTSNNDTCVKTDGTTTGTTFQAGPPKGTMVAFTPDRMAVSGVSGNGNTIYVSQANNFLNFTVGPNNGDPFTEVIAAPGSRITHIAYYFGKLFWWKDQSFGFISFSTQYDLTVTIISNQIGTLDNSSAFWNAGGFDSGVKFSGTTSTGGGAGGIYFRGQDNHIYLYDGYFLTRMTRQIAPTIQSANRKKANAWTQTTQADFAAGASTPTVNISTSISPGDVTVSSFGATDNSSTQWNLGVTNNTTVWTSSISLSTNNSGNVAENGFESGSNNACISAASTGWSQSGNLVSGSCNTNTSNWLYKTSWSPSGEGCTLTPHGGSLFVEAGYSLTSPSATAYILNAADNSVLVSKSLPQSDSGCSWTQDTLSAGTNVGKRVKIRFATVGNGLTDNLTTSQSFILGGDITFYRCYLDSRGGTNPSYSFDDVTNGSSTITTGWFNSQAYNTGLSSSIAQVQASWNVTTSTPSVGLFTSASSNGPWLSVANSTGTNGWVNQYVRYSSTFTLSAADAYVPYISSVAVVARSTGSYYSAVNNAPNLTTWGLFTANDQTNNGTISYFTRSSTSTFTVLSSTPAWSTQSKNATVTASTGTYFQLRADFALTAATQTPTINDFTFNWTEGSASDKAYIHYFNDAIWVSVSSGTVSINNRILYYDLLNQAWLVYDIPANGFLTENGKLYFGSPSVGNVLQFGGVQTDSGTAINSYWKSKDFTGINTDPFTQNEYIRADFLVGQASGTVLSYVYQTDQHNSTTVTLPLYDASASLLKRGLLLAKGQIGTFYNFQVGDNSSNPKWTLFAHHVSYNPLNWIPQTR